MVNAGNRLSFFFTRRHTRSLGLQSSQTTLFLQKKTDNQVFGSGSGEVCILQDAFSNGNLVKSVTCKKVLLVKGFEKHRMIIKKSVFVSGKKRHFWFPERVGFFFAFFLLSQEKRTTITKTFNILSGKANLEPSLFGLDVPFDFSFCKTKVPKPCGHNVNNFRKKVQNFVRIIP